jgi:oxygen-independent coproporphyrinogen-3 oxidase
MERRWNVANNNLYIKGINENCPEREKETLTSAQKLNEFIMISLRTKEGMDLTRLEKEFGLKEKDRIKSEIEKFKDHNLIFINNSFIQLTDEGMLRADGIASELFSN